jgi:hypothetical protein
MIPTTTPETVDFTIFEGGQRAVGDTIVLSSQAMCAVLYNTMIGLGSRMWWTVGALGSPPCRGAERVAFVK